MKKILAFMLPLLVAGTLQPLQAEDNMRFFGALVNEPCNLQPGDESVELDFGTVVDKYIYSNSRTIGKTFQLHLIDCDISIGKEVKVIFSGSESVEMPGYLALNSASQAAGIVIGLETMSGNFIPLSSDVARYSLVNGMNVINLKAFVQGESEALKNKGIIRGGFSSVTSFLLEYQ